MDPNKIEFLKNKIDSIFEKVKGFREHLHQNPELSFQEFNTMEFVANQLEKIGIPHDKNIAGTGVVGIIRGTHHSQNTPCIGLRADLDALPIHEENEVNYKSKVEGVMHACGHDVHTSILLGVAEVLFELKEQLSEPIKLIFQPGEEMNPGGASLMIQAGILENPRVERMYGLHVFPDFSRVFSIVFCGFGLVLLVLGFGNWYTMSACILAILLVLVFDFWKKASWYPRFALTYTIAIVPFLVVNGILTGAVTPEPIVWYSENHIVGWRIVTIPVEDLYYNMGMLLPVVALYTFFARRAGKAI
jgi:lycopene cyclase domain-containing protein